MPTRRKLLSGLTAVSGLGVVAYAKMRPTSKTFQTNETTASNPVNAVQVGPVVGKTNSEGENITTLEITLGFGPEGDSINPSELGYSIEVPETPREQISNPSQTDGLSVRRVADVNYNSTRRVNITDGETTSPRRGEPEDYFQGNESDVQNLAVTTIELSEVEQIDPIESDTRFLLHVTVPDTGGVVVPQHTPKQEYMNKSEEYIL